MKPRKRFLLMAMLFLLLLPTVVVQAQEDDPPPWDDDFVDSLVMSAVNHNMMDGDTDNSDLRELGKIVDVYYAVRIADVEQSGFDNSAEVVNDLHEHRNSLITKLQRKIQGDKPGATNFAINLFIRQILVGLEEPEKKCEPAVPPLSVVSGDDDMDYVREESRFLSNFENHVDRVVALKLVFNSPSMAPAVTDSTAWTYTPPPAISNSAPPVSAPAAEVAPPSAAISAPSAQDPPEGNNEIFLKPIGFNNTGFDAVTVVVESYTPAEGYSPALSTASTVVFPESNSSGYLNLPLGTYTFCYYWELDEDFNDDGNMDYHHKVSGPASLNVKSSDSPESAIRVTLNPNSNVSNPNGKCGENLTGNASNLTPEEAANAGRHTYAQTCSGIYGGGSCDDSGVDMFSLDISFSSGTVTGIADGERVVVPRIAVNQYQQVAEDGAVSTFTFTADGFIIYFVAGGEWPSDAILTYIRQ